MSAAHVERIQSTGYAVLETDFAATEIAALATRLDALMERQTEEFGGAERLAGIGDAANARLPLVYDDAFLRLIAHPPLLSICRTLLGDYMVLLLQNGIINAPGRPHSQSVYHRDLPYQEFVSSRPLAVSALFCLDEFRRDNGALTVLPASHRRERVTSTDPGGPIETVVVAAAGSFIIFDSMLVHRAGYNASTAPRRAINHVFGLPILAQPILLPAALQGRHAGNPDLARLLGYESGPALSVNEWRERRLRRRS